MPPAKKPGSLPARSSTQASRVAVVVLPWVPATTSGRLPRRKRRLSAWGKDRWGMPAASRAWTSGLARETAFPTTTRTGRGTRRSEEHTSELQSPDHLVCRLLLEKKKKKTKKKRRRLDSQQPTALY